MVQDRRKFCRVATSLLIGSVMTIGLAEGQPNPYREVENWAKLPEGRRLGAMSSVDVDSQGNVWICDRCGGDSCVGSKVAPILKFDPSGQLLKSFGAGLFAVPHGIHVDRDGNVWVADSEGGGGRGHTVIKLSPDGTVLLTLGEPGVTGEGPDTFNQPSDVVTSPSGEVFVADGHGDDSNSRVVKFSKDGKFIKAWGKRGSGPGEFDSVHTIALDSGGRVFVGDRNNNRIQIFDQDGKFIEEWRQFSRPSGIFIDRNDLMYVADPQSNAKLNPGFGRGIRIGSARDGRVVAYVPDAPPKTPDGGTWGVEGVAVDSTGSIYGTETNGMRARKFVKK
jgi:streptogramin lyase